MPNFGKFTQEQFKSITSVKKSRVDVTNYVKFLEDLGDDVGNITVGKDEKKVTVRQHLDLAAKQMGIYLKFERGDQEHIVFSITDAPPEPRTRKLKVS